MYFKKLEQALFEVSLTCIGLDRGLCTHCTESYTAGIRFGGYQDIDLLYTKEILIIIKILLNIFYPWFTNSPTIENETFSTSGALC